MEELDNPGEFFFDSKTSKLYLFYNSSGDGNSPPPADLSFIAPQLPMLVNVSGTQAAPVKDVSFEGIKFSSTSYTYMGEWCAPGTSICHIRTSWSHSLISQGPTACPPLATGRLIESVQFSCRVRKG
jgi:hypothetical protein